MPTFSGLRTDSEVRGPALQLPRFWSLKCWQILQKAGGPYCIMRTYCVPGLLFTCDLTTSAQAASIPGYDSCLASATSCVPLANQ